MGREKPWKFRFPGCLGANGSNDLRFNELGGSRIPGATGSTVPPQASQLTAPKLALSNDAGTGGEITDAGISDAGSSASGATDAGMTASPIPFSPVLSDSERSLVQQAIMRGNSREEAREFLRVLGGKHLEYGFSACFTEPDPLQGGKHLKLSDATFSDPAEPERLREISSIYDEFDQLTLREFMQIRSSVQASFEPDKDERKKAKSKGQLQVPSVQAWQNYRNLRHLYIEAGYQNPPEELNKIKTGVTFLGNRVIGGVHPEFDVILKAAEAKLKGGPLALNFSLKLSIGGFVPRPISDDMTTLSNHAIGKAVDIDADPNPQFSKSEAVILDKVLEWLKSQKAKGVPWLQKWCHLSGPYPFSRPLDAKSLSDSSTAAYREMQQNSEWIKAFLREFYPMRERLKAEANQARKYLKRAHQEMTKGQPVAPVPGEQAANDRVESSDNLEQLISALARAKPSMTPEHASDFGILTLPPQIFAAMAEAGARSGLEYNHKKDSMHFEVFPRVKGSKK